MQAQNLFSRMPSEVTAPDGNSYRAEDLLVLRDEVNHIFADVENSIARMNRLCFDRALAHMYDALTSLERALGDIEEALDNE